MGLDITVYQNIRKASIKEIETDGYDFKAFVVWEGWKDRVRNLEYNQYYIGNSVYSFGYGYGSHRVFRDKLALLTGKNLDWHESNTGEEAPFYELIHFADNEGCLDFEVSEKLYQDFIQFKDKAHETNDEIFKYNYDEWTKIFELSRDNGVVNFH